MKAHLVGSGIASLAAASYLIRDAKVPAGNITVYEGEAAGGAMALYGGSGTYYGGYVLPAARILERVSLHVGAVFAFRVRQQSAPNA